MVPIEICWGKIVKKIENYLKDFSVEHKHPSPEAQRRWRSAVSLVRNPRRRFRHVANLAKRSKAQKIQENIRVALYAKRAALRSDYAGGLTGYKPSEEARQAGFDIHPDELAAIIRRNHVEALDAHGGVDGIARKVSVSLNDGICERDIPTRQNIFGVNCYAEKQARTFWMFVWKALQHFTPIILMVCAAGSMAIGIATKGWRKGMYDGLGIILGILLVVVVTATSDYKQSLQFKKLDEEKKKIFVDVTRDGKRKKISIYDLVVGDTVHLQIGDQVPADGLFISGYRLLIDKSSMFVNRRLVRVHKGKPFLLCGTKVRDGSAKMLVTTVGMRTGWGKLMEILSEGGEDETPLQVKLNGIATIMGKIGLTFAVLTFVVLTARFLLGKAIHNEISHWSLTDALKLWDYFAVPEGLPLAVTLSLAFAMNKLMSERALVRKLSAGEMMGAITCICTNKTGMLTTNHMVVSKVWICEKSMEVEGKESEKVKSELSEEVLSILLQAIFQNIGCEVANQDGKIFFGSPIETAILQFGLLLGADFDAQRRDIKILMMEPYNSVRKKMSILVARPDGVKRAFCNGASEIILRMCNKVVDLDGEPVDLSVQQVRNITEVINSFASEALRTFCLAYQDLDDSFDENNIPKNGYTLVAVVGIKDPVRPGVKKAVETCLAAGITVRMVTGDNIITAKAIAKECGILKPDGLAVEGQSLRNLSSEQMEEIIPRVQVMARSSPSDKHMFVTNLRRLFGEVVAVTGCGIDDAPALREADIGLAMGIAGAVVAKENAEVTIMDDNFSTIVNVVKWGRALYINNQKFLQFQLTVNVVALVLTFLSACISGSAALTTVQLQWVNMIMNTLGAWALATEPPNDLLMERLPLERDSSFITKAMWRNIIGQSIYQLAVLAVLKFDGKKLLKLTGSDSTAVLNTLIFNAFVFCQVFNKINSRDIEEINIFRGMFSSWIFIGVMFATVAFQVIIVEFLGIFASTVPLSWELWLLSVLIGLVSLIVGVVLKCIPGVVKKTKQQLAVNNSHPTNSHPSSPQPSIMLAKWRLIKLPSGLNAV